MSVPSPPVLDSVSSPRPIRAAGCVALIKPLARLPGSPLPCRGAAWGGPNTSLCTVYLTKLPKAKGGRSEGRPARRACGQQPLTPTPPTLFTVTSRRPRPRPQLPVSAEGLWASEVHSPTSLLHTPQAASAGRTEPCMERGHPLLEPVCNDQGRNQVATLMGLRPWTMEPEGRPPSSEQSCRHGPPRPVLTTVCICRALTVSRASLSCPGGQCP